MKTVTYQQVFDRAAEFAQRTRDKVPSSEATMLLGFIAAELNVMWPAVAWPELCDNLEQVSLTNTDGVLSFSKREGEDEEGDEMGDILWVGTADPRKTTKVRGLKFTAGNGLIYVLDSCAGTSEGGVWVDWQLPVTDLFAVASESLAATTLPARFFLPLAYKASGHLLRTGSDSEKSLGNEMLALGEAELNRQMAQLEEPRWRGVRVR